MWSALCPSRPAGCAPHVLNHKAGGDHGCSDTARGGVVQPQLRQVIWRPSEAQASPSRQDRAKVDIAEQRCADSARQLSTKAVVLTCTCNMRQGCVTGQWSCSNDYPAHKLSERRGALLCGNYAMQAEIGSKCGLREQVMGCKEWPKANGCCAQRFGGVRALGMCEACPTMSGRPELCLDLPLRHVEQEFVHRIHLCSAYSFRAGTHSSSVTCNLASSDAEPFSTDSNSLSRNDAHPGTSGGCGSSALGACGGAGRVPGDNRWMEKLAERSGSSGSSVRRFCMEQQGGTEAAAL